MWRPLNPLGQSCSQCLVVAGCKVRQKNYYVFINTEVNNKRSSCIQLKSINYSNNSYFSLLLNSVSYRSFNKLPEQLK